jgi:Rps23 Pro-64 3,4-dihydroxylase Tpa1-like proline 4-hydroxylase
MDSIVRGLSEPFPHLIIENMYNEQELDLIWEELNFLSKPHKFLKEDLGTGRTEIGESKSSSKSIHLDGVYTDRVTSNILTLNRKLFEREIMERFAEISPMCRSILSQNNDTTKIRYYENGDEYMPHRDVFNYTAITFFFKRPKKFEGGELTFPEFDYTVNCNDNSLILFPSCILHAANKVKMIEDPTCSGNGRYSMMQFLKIV